MLQELNGRTAVVTGAASGIGLGLARRCLHNGMNVAMLDIETQALAEAAAELGEPTRVSTHVLDVADPAAVDAAADAIFERFGSVQLLCNNAGVSITGPLWAMTPQDWEWALGVNVLGVGNGLRAFVPRMIAGGEPGHVVNTASLAGLTPTPHAGVYSATKAAVVALSEVLLHDLREEGHPIGVSVLCPGLVSTKIVFSHRNRPPALQPSGDQPVPPEASEFFKLGDAPDDVADKVLRAVAEDDFYVLTNLAARPAMDDRSQALIGLTQPAKPAIQSIFPDSMSGAGS